MDELPGRPRINQQHRESGWARFWRRRRIKAISNSSDHATVIGFGMVIGIVLIVAVLVLGFRGVDFSSVHGGSPRKSVIPTKP